jgi:hypothetical protein
MGDIVDHMFQNFFASISSGRSVVKVILWGFKLVCSMSISRSIINSIHMMLRL